MVWNWCRVGRWQLFYLPNKVDFGLFQDSWCGTILYLRKAMDTAAMYIILKQIIQAILLNVFVMTCHTVSPDKYSRIRFDSTRIKVKCNVTGHIPSGIPSNTEEL